MSTIITNSPDISVLQSKVTADLCGGNFIIDVTPSTFKTGGAAVVNGASVKITNPVNVVIRNYITSGYDIVPPMTGSVSVAIPLVAGNYQYGNYIIEVKLTDSDNTEYVVSKTVNICPPDSKNKTKKEGCLNASIKGNCKDGKVVIMLDHVPNYKGLLGASQVNDLDVEYPTAINALPPFTTVDSSFSVKLFEGIYKVSGNVCATYNGTDNTIYKVKYIVKCEKNIKCSLDECCIQDKIAELNLKSLSDCTQAEKDNTSAIMGSALWLLNAAKGAANCGDDPSDYISQLEDLLGCNCTCNCNEGTPYINNSPVTDFVFAGCGFTENTTGLTKTITFDNLQYDLTTPVDSRIILGEPVIDEETCTKTQEISLDETGLINQTSGDTRYVKKAGDIMTGALTAPQFASPVQVLPDATTIVFNAAMGANARTTLGGNRILSFSNTVAGTYYTLIIVQDGTGSRQIILPAGSKVINGGAGVLTLTTAANSVDLITIYYDGTTFYFTYGKNYN